MPDLARLRNSLLDRYPEPWVRQHLESLTPAYFEAFDEPDVARHLGLMMELGDDRPLVVHARPADPGEWWVEVVGYDAFQFLSTVCTMLAVQGFSIQEGRVFTSQPPRDPVRPARRPIGPPALRHPRRPPPPRGPDRRRKVVDAFRVRQVAGTESGDAPDWDAFQEELASLVRLLREDRYDEVHRLLIGRFVAALRRLRPEPSALEPIDLVIDPEASEFATTVRIGARGSFGFLSLTARALALCGIMIVQADIRTGVGRIDDTFWVTDRFGRKIADEPALRELRLSLVLIEHFSGYLHRATNPEAALVHFSRFVTETMARPEWAEEFAALDRPAVLDALVRVLGESDFLWEDYLQAQPENLLPMVCDPAQWERRRSPAELAAELDAALAGAATRDERCRAARRFMDREVFRAGVRAILGLSGGPDRFSAELSDVAEALLRASYRVALDELAPRAPRRGDGRPVPAALFALGKCGGRELGFGSDLELMLVYADRDIAEGAGSDFDGLVATLRRVLDGRRGGTFDVDFRLRPYGRGGPPATSLTTFDQYYRAGGPAWSYERQALIKLRAVAGDPGTIAEVEALRDRFVYGPEPFDLDGCLRMRRLQVEQLIQPGTINAKYSPGGLVDAAYFVQALQIAHGAGEPAARSQHPLRALAALGAAGRVGPRTVQRLRAGYTFFRTLIDALRVVHGHAKDLTVPDARSEEFERLARRMRFAGPDDLQDELQRRLRETRELWDRIGPFLVAGHRQTPDD